MGLLNGSHEGGSRQEIFTESLPSIRKNHEVLLANEFDKSMGQAYFLSLGATS